MNKTNPPRLFQRFFTWYCQERLQEAILGDLDEQFAEDLEKHGPRRAKRRFAWNVIRFFRPGIAKSFEGSQKLNQYGMFKNYFKVSMRNILRNKTFSFLNVSGLSLGIASCVLILIYVNNELSYDQYNEQYESTYRVIHYFGDPAQIPKADEIPANEFQVWGNAPVAPALQRNFPEIQHVFRFTSPSPWLITYGSKKFQENNIVFADSTAFKVFDWPVIAGNPETALSRPNTIVLTEQLAKKYFGDKNPIGETLRMDNKDLFEVTAVMQIPSNSHFSFDGMISMSTFHNRRPGIFDMWGYVDFYTYFTIPKSTAIDQLNNRIDAFVKENFNSDFGYTIRFEPLAEAYLHSDAGRQPGATGSMSNIYIFISVAAFILLIALINFMNLSTARSVERAKEVAIRKTVGSSRVALIAQFLVESIILAALASLIAAGLILLAHPYLESLSNKSLQIDWLFTANNIAIGIGVVMLIGIAAGSYPAFVLSGFRAIKVLKGSFKTSSNGIWLRKSLVVLQFSLSIILLVGATVIYKQLDHLRRHDLGFEPGQILVVDFGWDGKVQQKINTIKSAFLQHKAVESVSASRATPGDFFPNAGTGIEDPETGELVYRSPAIYEIDEDFVPTYQMTMAAGRNYSKDHPHDTTGSMILNEAAAKLFGYSNPEDIIGKSFAQWGREGKVVGVIKDFNYVSLHKDVEPLSLRYSTPRNTSMISLRLKSNNYSETLRELETIWTEMFPHYPFIAHFNNASFNQQYEADERFGSIFTVFSFLAMVVACLGLFGLTLYSTTQRTKEIGVRKVLGASTSRIVTLLSLDFIKLFGIALLIAIPISWYAMTSWLSDFAYRISVSWEVFLMAAFVTLAISLITMSFKTVTAALSNPVDSLRDE